MADHDVSTCQIVECPDCGTKHVIRMMRVAFTDEERPVLVAALRFLADQIEKTGVLIRGEKDDYSVKALEIMNKAVMRAMEEAILAAEAQDSGVKA